MHSRAPFSTVLAVSAAFALTAPALAFELEKRLPLAAGGTAVVRSEAGSVKVRGADISEAIAVVRSNRADFEKKYVVRLETPSPDRIEVIVESRSHGIFNFDGGGNSKTEVEVTLPKSAAAEVESSGGSVEISGVDGTVRAESSGGGVHAENLGGAANLSSSGGSVQVEGIAGDLEASSSGGGVRISGAGGRVVADSSGGAVSVAFAAGNARGGDLDSSGGGVAVSVDAGVGLEIDASSSGGSVDCELPVTVRGRVDRDSIHGKLNAGGNVLKLRSSGGGVSISAL